MLIDSSSLNNNTLKAQEKASDEKEESKSQDCSKKDSFEKSLEDALNMVSDKPMS